MPTSDNIAVVVIGRNEGQRLEESLRSIRQSSERIVYVDSGSTDGSPEAAERLGARVHRLSADRPFSAARGRNEGFALAAEIWPSVRYVQFVDGDCTLDPAWLAAGAAHLEEHEDVAVITGRNRERFPEASVYNALCDIEWDGPLGDQAACGGNAMYRAAPFAAAGGFDASVKAGEEPELCLRLRREGFRVVRIGHEMTVHDADMHRFGEWWKRAVRSGTAYCTGALMHGRGPERYNVRETLRAVIWGGVLPLLALVGLFAAPFVTLAIFVLYGVKLLRIGLRHRGRIERPFRYGAFMVLLNIAEFVGVTKCLARR